MRYGFVVLCAVVLVVGASPVGATAGSSGWMHCGGLSGTARLSPGLPQAGRTDLVVPTVSINDAKLSGCSGSVKTGTASGSLKFARPLNCTSLIDKITANVPLNAEGTMRIVWNTHRTSTVALKFGFGAVHDQPALAAVTGTVTAGQFKGQKASGDVLWALGPTECFGGAPLTSVTFHLYTLTVTK